ncbi:MAG: hypothetical protein HUJ69_06305 [Lachnospiraceae bacterium]|nr:hypothetical protein [Lachnospiraceae bacterium]
MKDTTVYVSWMKTRLREFGIPIPDITDQAYADDYRYILRYALENERTNTILALAWVHYRMTLEADKVIIRAADVGTRRSYLQHAFSVCRMLIDLHATLSPLEEDRMLASSLCHVLPENFPGEETYRDMTAKCGLDAAIPDTVSLIYRDDDGTDASRTAYYERIRQDKLAVMIKLADRGNLVEQLYSMSNHNAHAYIYETRTFFFPLCIYAKDHYPDIMAPVDIMMEKLSCLLEVGEILLGRFETRETELVDRILSLEEENATLRRMIRTLEM